MNHLINFLFLSLFSLICDSIISQSCFPDGVHFSTQTQINNFSFSFPNCTEILGDVTIEGNTSSSIQSIDGLSQLTTIHGDLRIAHNAHLYNLEGLINLDALGGDLLVYDNSNLSSLEALAGLDAVGGFLHIHTNPSLEDLTGLNNISDVGESLLIFDNDNLEDISALGQIATIRGSLTVAKNDSLTTLVGLQNIFFGIADLRIFANPLLSVCSLPRICSYLSNGGNHTITGNATGCSSSQEISAFCLLASPCSKAIVSVDFNPVVDGTYQAIQEVNSSGQILRDGQVEFLAGNCIVIESGFSIAKNATLLADIESCGL